MSVISKKVFDNNSYKEMMNLIDESDKLSIESEVHNFSNIIESFAEKLLEIANDPKLSEEYRAAILSIKNKRV